MRIGNTDAFTEPTPEDLKSISSPKQIKIEPKTEGLSVHVIQLAVTDDSF